MSSARTLSLVGLLLLVAGLVTGFMPVSSQGANCGSAFHASQDAYVSDLAHAMEADSGGVSLGGDLNSAEEACASLRSTVRIPAVVLLALGGVLLGAWVLRSRPSAPPSSSGEATSDA